MKNGAIILDLDGTVVDSPQQKLPSQAVGHKVAMGNAVPELKEVADEVIGDVSDDGLADYLIGIFTE